MTAYRVTAPYVQLRISDPVTGKAVINGFYAQAIVTSRVEEESLKRHLERGWLEVVEKPAAEPAPEPKVAKVPESTPDKVPDGTAADVRSWVGDNTDRAALALAAELKSASPRTTLVDQLKKLTGQA